MNKVYVSVYFRVLKYGVLYLFKINADLKEKYKNNNKLITLLYKKTLLFNVTYY